jgi:hypothetical protein
MKLYRIVYEVKAGELKLVDELIVIGKGKAEAKASFEDMIDGARGLKGQVSGLPIMYDLTLAKISVKNVTLCP